jgi:septal ring factor EnvC (AmiA/AmiB activator)
MPAVVPAQEAPLEEGPTPGQIPGDLQAVQEDYLHALEEEAKVRDDYNAAVARVLDLSGKIADLDQRLAEVGTELASAESQLTDAEARLADTERSLAQTETQLTLEKSRLRNQAVQAYIGGGATPVPDLAAALKNAAAADDVANAQVYAEIVVSDRKALVTRVSTLRESADELRGQAETVREEAAGVRDEVAGRHAELERMRTEQVDAQAAAGHASAVQQLFGKIIVMNWSEL